MRRGPHEYPAVDSRPVEEESILVRCGPLDPDFDAAFVAGAAAAGEGEHEVLVQHPATGTADRRPGRVEDRRATAQESDAGQAGSDGDDDSEDEDADSLTPVPAWLLARPGSVLHDACVCEDLTPVAGLVEQGRVLVEDCGDLRIEIDHATGTSFRRSRSALWAA